MKKSIILAMSLAIPAMAGEMGPLVVAPAPVAAPAPTPAPVVAPAECPLGIEVGAVYTSALNDLTDGVDGIDTWGVDVTAVYDLCPNWAITLRGTWAEGDKHGIDATVWSVMPGVRYTAPITEDLSWYVGANVGVANVEYSAGDYSKDDTGFAYSAEIGLSYDLTDNLYIYGALQGNGNTAEPAEADKQYGIGARAGLGWKF